MANSSLALVKARVWLPVQEHLKDVVFRVDSALTMRLFSANDYRPIRKAQCPETVIFRQAWWAPAIMAALMLGLSAGAVKLILARPGFSIGDFFVVLFGLLFLLLFKVSLHALFSCFRHTNWTLRLTHEGMFIQIRAACNYHRPETGPTGVFINYDEVLAVREVRYRMSRPQSDSEATWTERYLEIELNHDETRGLKDAIDAHRRSPAPTRGFTKVIFHHYPVRVPHPNLIQIAFRGRNEIIRPSLRRALKALAAHVRVDERMDFDQREWNAMSDEDFTDYVIERIESGDRLGAASLLRTRYDYSFTEAQQFIQDITGEAA